MKTSLHHGTIIPTKTLLWPFTLAFQSASLLQWVALTGFAETEQIGTEIEVLQSAESSQKKNNKGGLAWCFYTMALLVAASAIALEKSIIA